MKPFIPEDLNRKHTVTLTEGQISTILYYLEEVSSTWVGKHDEESKRGIVDSIFEVLENSYDEQVECYVDDEKVSCSTFKDDYADKVDSLVDRMVKFDLECG